MIVQSRMLLAGNRLGRYDLLARLRAGGMATLYLGRRVGAAGFSRPVAIKVIHPHLAQSPRFVQMFVDEATLSAKIDDPHVVHVEELGEENGTFFLVMEYVDGVSLAELLRELSRRKRALSVELATWIGIQIAAGLHAAHEATNEAGQPLGIVHRDVSPHNVLLAFKGHVKLIDFGVAKAHGRPGDTQTGSLRGKLAYMPPEQAFGRSVDRRADVYALGVVLWEMLTMRRLFNAENDFALLEMVRSPSVTPPSALVADIPSELEAVVMAALAPDPAARPATAEELRARLVGAVPQVAGKTASDLAGLMAAVLPDVIERSRERLAEALGESMPSEDLGAPPSSTETALATMTVTMPEAGLMFEEARDEVVPAVAMVPGSATRTPRRVSSKLPMVLAVLAAASVVFLATAVGITMHRATAASAPPAVEAPSPAPAEPPPASTSTSVSTAPAEPPPASTSTSVSTSTSTEPAPAPPSEPRAAASERPRAAAAAPRSTGTTHASYASPAHHRKAPHRPHAATTVTTSSVEMHGATPIFKKDL